MNCLQGLWQLRTTGVAGIHGDKGHDGRLELYLGALK